MTKEEKLYHEVAQKNADAEESQMFGKPCYKINGKAFVAFFQQCMAAIQGSHVRLPKRKP